MIAPFLHVAIGGALGACLRFALGLALLRPGFPVGVLTANVVGCFVMGLAVIWLGQKGLTGWQPFVMTGVLGGFTTFSAFGLETITLIERGQAAQAIAYVGLSVGLSLGALVVGVWIMRGLLS